MIVSNLLFCVDHYYEQDYVGAEHSHPCYELVYYKQGRGDVLFGDMQYRFQKDTFMVCGPRVKHIERGARGTEVLYIGFEQYDDVSLPMGLFREEDYGVLPFLENIYYETKHWTKYSYQLINLYTSIIALRLLNKEHGETEGVASHNLENIVGYIAANFNEDIDVRWLARIAGYSYDHFRKMFAKKFGMTVNDYILQKRISAATDMLKSNKYLIKEIAAACGFSSAAQFCTKYREVMGISPKQMQQKMEQDEQSIEKDRFFDE